MSQLSPAVWKASLTAPHGSALTLSEAMEPYCDTVTLFEISDDSTDFRVEGYCEFKPDFDALKTAIALSSKAMGLDETPALEVEELPPTNWLQEAYDSFPPIEAGKFFVHGSHIEAEDRPANKICIQLDAALAFGSGEHGTTYGCLLALNNHIKRLRNRKIKVLDMGCGSGILGIAAAKALKTKVLCVDIDPVAVDVTRENAKLNRCSRLIDAAAGDGYKAEECDQHGPFDLILCNILAGPLKEMAPDLRKNLAPGGTAILSGLLTSQEVKVRRAQEEAGLKLVRKYRNGDWSALVFQG